MESGLGIGRPIKTVCNKRIRVIPRRGISESQSEGSFERFKTARDTAIGRICMCPVPSRRAARAGHDNAFPCM